MKKAQVQGRMKRLVVPCDKLSSHPFGIDADDYAYLLQHGGENGKCECVETVKKGNAVVTPYWLKLAEDYTDMKPLEAFHREILFALISAYEQGFKFVTISMTFDNLTGGDKRHIYEEQYEAIKRAIDKLRRTEITVDLTDLFKACPNYRKNYSGRSARLVGYLLPAHYIEAEVNGQKTITLELLAESPLMTVAKAKNQIMAYDAAPLNIPNQHNTERVITVKNWLLRRIELAKQRGLNKSILFDTLYAECGLAGASKRQKQEARKTVFAVLDAFKSEGVIKDYEVDRAGSKYRAVIIDAGYQIRKQS